MESTQVLMSSALHDALSSLHRVQRDRPLKLLTHPATVAFGLANLYLIDLTAPILASDHDFVYHLIGSASSVILPIVIYIVALSLLLTALLLVAERGGRLRVVIWSAVLLLIPSILLYTVGNFTGKSIPDWITYFVAGVCFLSLVGAALGWKSFLPRFEAIRHVAAVILGFFAFSGVVIFAQLLWNGWQARNLNKPAALHQAAASLQPHPRIVWIVFDELSQQQVFEQRYPGLELPAFDRLAAQSTVFTHAIPTGDHTHFVLPSLITGIPANEIQASASGRLVALRSPANGRLVAFDQHDTVFQDAIDAGYDTAVDGWYNPYCRIMPAVLDHCFWTYREFAPANLSSHRSVGRNLFRPFRYLWLDIKHLFGRGPGAPSDEARNLRQHTMDYRGLLAAGDGYLADPKIDFLFLHLPIPHPYGIYDRAQKNFAAKPTSYVDNLALADVYLAHVREILERQNQWDSATVVVMGDHSWRTSKVWVDSMIWTDEDNAASHGGAFDDRPAYLVKLPGQQTSAKIDAGFSAIHTRALFDAVMQGRLHSPADLEAWAREQK
jgi:hypothetical protein